MPEEPRSLPASLDEDRRGLADDEGLNREVFNKFFFFFFFFFLNFLKVFDVSFSMVFTGV